MPFEPAALTSPPIGPDDDDPAVVALRRDRARHPGDAGVYRLLARTDSEALFLETTQGDDGRDYLGAWTVEKKDGVWTLAGGGSCRLAAVFDGKRADPWELDPAAPTPGPDSKEIAILVHVQMCTSGKTSEGRIRPPHVTYGASTVEIAITTDPPTGDQTCPGSPPTPFVVQLDEALGQRTLLDAGREPVAPPTPVGPPGI